MLEYFFKHQKKIIGTIIGLVYAVLVIIGLIYHPFAQNTDTKGKDDTLVTILQSTTTLQTFPVDHVDDGDTFAVKVDGGLATIRLIGINTPETVDPRKPVECYGPEASARAHELLGHTMVTLMLDPTQDSIDKYGRVLAYATLEDGTSYNEEMIREGFAYEYTYKTKYQKSDEFKQAQHDAQSEGLGLWSPSTCNGKK